MPQKTLQRYSFLSGREKQTQEKTPLPSTPPLIPLPPLPLFHFHHHPPSTAPKSTSSTSASRHRRHRLTDVDDVDLEGVEQRGKRMCRYRTYINALSQLFGSLLDNMVVLFVHFSSSHVSFLKLFIAYKVTHLTCFSCFHFSRLSYIFLFIQNNTHYRFPRLLLFAGKVTNFRFNEKKQYQIFPLCCPRKYSSISEFNMA